MTGGDQHGVNIGILDGRRGVRDGMGESERGCRVVGDGAAKEAPMRLVQSPWTKAKKARRN